MCVAFSQGKAKDLFMILGRITLTVYPVSGDYLTSQTSTKWPNSQCSHSLAHKGNLETETMFNACVLNHTYCVTSCVRYTCHMCQF